MESIEMVRCYLSGDPDQQGTVRYVPLEIYELWRFLMERVHNLAIAEPVVSKWNVEENPGDLGDGDEEVIEVSFKYKDTSAHGRPVIRYLPELNYDKVVRYLFAHFPEKDLMEGVNTRKGVFLASKASAYTS
jgi:hypothetical protein